LNVSLPGDKEVLTVLQITNFQTGGETSREGAKRPGIETSKGAKRPDGEPSRYSESSNMVAKRPVANRPGSESSNMVAKCPGGELAK